ncbi:MAG TPA: hypothetical protein VFE47_31485 [Tepidisphaeraceae bacterium]|jgi:hypothetical protein|nr:hypothetical protein [Tepidisphaeraceae bacterium]
MRIPSETLSQLILKQLAGGEMRLLTLVVGIRRSLKGAMVKGDLSARVQSALRGLIASKCVVDEDGVYSLAAVGSSL